MLNTINDRKNIIHIFLSKNKVISNTESKEIINAEKELKEIRKIFYAFAEEKTNHLL